MDDITEAVAALTYRLRAYRIARALDMPIEIKGIKGKALKARANLDALSAAYDEFNEMAPAHVADVHGLTEQVSGMQSDLEFAANAMGNSNGKSDEELDEKPKEPFLKPGAGNGAG